MAVAIPRGVAVTLVAVAALRLVFQNAAHFPGESPVEHLPGVAQFLVSAQDRRRLIPGVDHAVFAARIAAAAVFIPWNLLDKLAKRGIVAIRHQIAGTF